MQEGPNLVVAGSDVGESDAIVTTDGESWGNLTYNDAYRLRSADTPAQEACVPADPSRCYRTVPGRLAVEQTNDAGATWNAAWSISSGRQDFLIRAYRGHSRGNSQVAAQSVGVLPVGDQQHLVVVAAGREGVVLRHADGRW